MSTKTAAPTTAQTVSVFTSCGTTVRAAEGSELQPQGGTLALVADLVDYARFVPSGEVDAQMLSEAHDDLLWGGGSAQWDAKPGAVVMTLHLEQGRIAVEALMPDLADTSALAAALNRAARDCFRRLSGALAVC